MKATIFVFILLLLLSCRHSGKTSDQFTIDPVDTELNENIEKAKNILNLMYLPSEMYKLFDKAGAQYNPDMLNKVENVNHYTTSSKAAINLGIYGVDLAYNKMFDQTQKIILYLTVINKLSNQLGIPDDKFAMTIKRVHKNINNKDSLTKYATEIYSNIDLYLGENQRHEIATLVIVGGWIESLYIASQIAKENIDNREIYDRIVMQKYSLRHLVNLLKYYKSDENIAELYVIFNDLKFSFEKIETQYSGTSLSIDTLNMVVSSNKLNIVTRYDDMSDILKKIELIRNKLIR